MRNDTLTDNQGATFEDEGLQSVAAESTGNESGSEYKGGGDKSNSESDAVNVIEEPDLEDEEPDTNIRWKVGKKQKKGLVARDQISAAVMAINDELSPRLDSESDYDPLKVAAPKTPSSKLSKTSRPRSGLVTNWQKVPRIRPQASVPSQSSGISVNSEVDSDSMVNTPTWSHHTSSGTGTGSQRDRHVNQPSSRATSSDVDTLSYGYGMLHSILSVQCTPYIMFPQLITKIQDIHSAPSPRANAANKSQKKKEISYESLPQGTKHQFKTQIIPIALDTTGTLKPWNAPSDESIIEIWNLVFGDKYPLNDGDNECYHFIVAQTLVSTLIYHPQHTSSSATVRVHYSDQHAISSWVHKFADIAEKALVNEFARQGLQTREERAALVQTLLGDADNMSDKKHPFIWESAYDDPSARPEGIFQGQLIARTFFEHVQVINTVDASYQVQEKPIGALIYAIQAVHHALLYSVTGALELPTDKKSAEFSKTNWGDYTLVTPRGEKVVKRTSVFLNKISTLKDQQWDDIFEKAIAFQAMVGKQRATAREPDIRESELVGEGLTDSESDDEELLDPRYDNVTIEEGP
ncbi:hypothetical protein EI94DRAFT_1815782 [Lactarius quietus]|nr:hypothetical protein EI94DRAFT_1815782 [Lactarius quietus]